MKEGRGEEHLPTSPLPPSPQVDRFLSFSPQSLLPPLPPLVTVGVFARTLEPKRGRGRKEVGEKGLSWKRSRSGSNSNRDLGMRVSVRGFVWVSFVFLLSLSVVLTWCWTYDNSSRSTSSLRQHPYYSNTTNRTQTFGPDILYLPPVRTSRTN
ncbi:hypothetical protein BXZ70DRAFT_932654 [Cristinia sonorae]|uniref:Uncharacterized protein n=1 Tax=Cristinia sonorae TaxID=1940300 RepID=A0A8K0UT33_9AGAR|nr:hypothetical protein BXZ70DRAFT_932654 [Cristinia sonorae]